MTLDSFKQHSVEYAAVKDFYGDRRAERSRVPLMSCRYGHDALEGVRFGWELAHGMHMEPKVEKPDPLLQGPGAGAYAMAGGNGYGRGL